jgi:hypothetical protein
VPHSSTISYSTTDDFCVYFSGTEQATPLHGHGEPSEGKLLGSELPFYSIKVALPLEFTVDPDSKKPGFLDWGDRLLAEANWRRGHCVYTGKVDKFTLLWGKLHPSCSSLLATDLPGAFEVSASRLYILTEGQEVQVIGEADCYETSLVVELSVETRGIEEEEDQREW